MPRSPAWLLVALSGARFAGEATADGEPARRIVGTLDLKNFLADLRQANGRLRRLRARLDANVSDLPADASKGTRDTIGRVQVALDIDLTGLDEPQRIATPAAG